MAVLLLLAVSVPVVAGTWSYNVYLSRTSGVLGTDWTYKHRVLFSGNGTKVTSYSVSDWSTKTSIGWSFSDSGDGGTFTYWSRGKQHKRTETNGHYRFSLAGVTIINDYPWVETTVRGDGGHWLNGRGY